MKTKLVIALISIGMFMNCENKKTETKQEKAINNAPFVWEGANLYFLLTDRFYNGDTANDVNFDRTKETGMLRGFEGGDIKGITQKIEEGYFDKLGVNAIWFSPVSEQIHGGTDEGTGLTYAFHGYWIKDWTAIEPNFGSAEDLHKLVDVAHKRGIRVVLDAVINHTGPVTDKDPVWPDEWVRTDPNCQYSNYENTITCTLVDNLPDIKTENNENVGLPPQLIEKWKSEGRYEQEVAELDVFFERTGYPRAPRFYIIKWLTDYITEFGIDGYRADTVKHVEEYVWEEFKVECDYAFDQWKQNNPEKVLDDTPFYLVGEVYNYNISSEKMYDFGDKEVNYFDTSFHSLINFEFKSDANNDYESIFSKYNALLNNQLKGFGTLNYLSSHDDGHPFDAAREDTYESANKLLLSPGTSQIYYGDESARSLIIEGTIGDATLRSLMNWSDIDQNESTQQLLTHWQKLGQFRNNHPAVGAGHHKMISKLPYIFSRSFSKDEFNDEVVVALGLSTGPHVIEVSSVFSNGEEIQDFYSGAKLTVTDGKVTINTESGVVLIEKI